MCPTLGQRKLCIARFRRAVARHAPALVDLIADEIGKPTHEALLADIAPLMTACRWHERNLARVLRARRVRGAGIFGLGQSHRVVREPLGRIALIATWNYPVQLLGIQLVQALAGGNRVVVKPSERSPRTHLALLRLAASCGLPDGMLTWTEPTREAGQALLISERFDHIVFTGSTAVGREIAEIAATSLTPTTLELSGRDSAIVLDDADPRLAARSIWHAVTINAGQTCMAPRRVLLQQGIASRFLDELAPLAAAARPLTMIDAGAAAHCHGLAQSAIDGGGRSLSAISEAPAGRALRPLAIVDCPRDAPLVDGDHFGPVVAVIIVRDELDALHVHHRCGQHLATSVFTGDPSRAEWLRPLLGATTVTVNDALLPTAHPATSIGGRGESGWGVSRGREGLLAMTRPVFVSSTARWPRPPLDAPTPTMARRMMRFLRWLYGGGAAGAPDLDTSLPSASSSGQPVGTADDPNPGPEGEARQGSSRASGNHAGPSPSPRPDSSTSSNG